MADTEKKKLIIIAGPTATGKSDAAVKLAKCIDGEIISADSIQVYKGMDIGSAKITMEEMQGVPHHLIDVMDIDQDYNVALFKDMAKAAINEIYERNHIPIICGGTGFYIQALIYDIDFTDETELGDNGKYRKSLEAIYEKKGCMELLELLKKEDPESYAAIDLNNIKRVIRALEFKQLHGYSIQIHNENERKKKDDPPYELYFFVLYGDRAGMYRRINERVDRMIKSGLTEECMQLKKKGLNRSSTAGQGIGYKEMLAYLDGECSLDEAVEAIKINTRHFAKRQLTWFKREKNTIWIDIDKGDPFNDIREYLQRIRNQ